MKKIFISVLILVFVAVLGFAYFRFYKKDDDGGRQAVFLTNGQVYFGHIQKKWGGYLIMKDIYYLKTNDDLTEDKNGESIDNKISIIKLGAELHGPEDQIYINKD